MEIKRQIYPPFARSRRGNSIAWIVVHYTACLTSAQNVARSFIRRGETSTHYIVDDTETIQLVEDYKCAWHVGGQKPENYCDACNANSIGVDLCERKRDTRTKSAEDLDWYFTDQTTDRAAQLIAYLADKHHIDDSHIVRHYDVTHKACPRPFVGGDMNLMTGTTGDYEWQLFKLKIDNLRNAQN